MSVTGGGRSIARGTTFTVTELFFENAVLVGSVNIGSFIDSRLFAGYSGNGSGDFHTGTVKGKTDGFSNGYVIASNFKNVSLASVDPTNDSERFGFVFNGSLRSLTVQSTKFKYDFFRGPEQMMPGSDFMVKQMV